MSGILDMIMGQLDQGKVGQIGQRIGASQDQTSQAIQAALPVILGQLTRNSQSSGAAEGLAKAITKDHDGSILDNLGGFLGQAVSDRDDRMMGHIFGNRRQNVERQLGKASGLDSGTMAKLMATLGPMVMGAIGKSQQQGGGGLADLLGQERQRAESKGTGFGVVDKLLDADGDGDVDMSDLLSRGSGILGGLFKR
ncbi:MAG: DUF937 domain-containing protein [Xanthomonadales bacterium]|nr:DUF937 domain-containing protein [Xanthomonadales bacterium]